ncbi:hypothetical protein [Thermofilum pendens]
MDEVLVAVLGSTVSIIGVLGGALYWLGGKFREIDYRFREVERRFEEVDRRFAEVNRRFEEIDRRFEEVNRRFEGIERGLAGLGERLGRLEAEVDRRFGELDGRVGRLAEAFTSYQEFLLEFLVAEGVLKPEKADLARREASRITSVAGLNPLTREEWEKVKKYLEKDELTLEEAEEFRELARRVVREYGQYPEAWKLHIYATIKLAEAWKKSKQPPQPGT